MPTNNKYRKFYEWKTNPELREIPDSSTRDRGSDGIVGVKPFGFPTAATNQFKVRMSGVALTDLKGQSGDFGELDVYGLTEVVDSYFERASFVPAKVIAGRKLETSQITTPTSNITGKKYKKKIGRVVTIPFGKVADTDTEFERQGAILEQIQDNFSVTFKPERQKRAR